MCGIAALIGPWSHRESRMAAMLQAQERRGPDDHGTWSCEHAHLGHRRLSIIDLSVRGRQPMCNEDGTLWIVFNGEVYNHAEIGRQLESRGHVMRSASDTEVIVHAFEEWGDACFARFNGMWGLVLWDTTRGTAVCARDRLGVKPLYYYADGDRLAAASEIKGILAAGMTASVNEAYTAHVIADGVLDDCGSETMFRDVHQLPAAHTLRFDIRQGAHRPSRYWHLDPESAAASYDYTDPVTTARDLLADAVRIRMLSSDVPVGSCLSGGMDSSSIVALAAGAIPGRLSTFTVEYPGTPSDESRYSRLVANTFGCETTSVAPDPVDYLDVLQKMTWFLDEPPVSSNGSFSQWKVFELASTRVKAVLDGHGGDELFGGYPGHVDAYLRMLLAQTLRGRPGAIRTFGDALTTGAQVRGERRSRALARTLTPQSVLRRYSERRLGVQAGGLSPDLRALDDGRSPGERPAYGRDAVNAVLFDDLLRNKLPGYLHYEDRLSMAFSVESRGPFLDYRLVEYLSGLPGAVKLAGGRSKALLREAMRGITPDEVIDRTDKMGFSAPTSLWFRGPIFDDVAGYLLDDRTRHRGVLDMAQIGRTLRLHREGRIDAGHQIFRWLSLECWYRQFLDVPEPARWAPAARRGV